MLYAYIAQLRYFYMIFATLRPSPLMEPQKSLSTPQAYQYIKPQLCHIAVSSCILQAKPFDTLRPVLTVSMPYL